MKGDGERDRDRQSDRIKKIVLSTRFDNYDKFEIWHPRFPPTSSSIENRQWPTICNSRSHRVDNNFKTKVNWYLTDSLKGRMKGSAICKMTMQKYAIFNDILYIYFLHLIYDQPQKNFFKLSFSKLTDLVFKSVVFFVIFFLYSLSFSLPRPFKNISSVEQKTVDKLSHASRFAQINGFVRFEFIGNSSKRWILLSPLEENVSDLSKNNHLRSERKSHKPYRECCSLDMNSSKFLEYCI